LSGGRCFRLSVGPDRRCSGQCFLGQRPDPASASRGRRRPGSVVARASAGPGRV